MLRISCECERAAQVTLRLEGEVKGRWVEELRKECSGFLGAAQGGRRQLVLDLGGVSSIDAAALKLFRDLGAEPILVKNCSPYLAELLKDVVDVEP